MAEAVDRERNVRARDEHDPQFRRSPPDQRFDHADRPGGAVETFHLVDHDRQRLTDAGGEGVGDQGAQLLGALDRIGTDSRTRRRPEGDRQLGRHLGHPHPELADKASGELETVAFVPTRQPDPARSSVIDRTTVVLPLPAAADTTVSGAVGEAASPITLV